MTNYYDVLGVNVFADQREIKTRYKQLAIQFHPDKHGGNKEYEEKFKAINEAFQVLSNPSLRNRYDHKMFYSQPVEPTPYTTTHTARPTKNRPYTKPKVVKVQYTLRQYILASLLVVGLIAGAVVLFVVMNRYASNKYFQEAEAFQNEKSYDLAISKYMEVLEVDPNHAQANERMGDLFVEKKEFKKLALVFYQKALQNYDKPSSELIFKTSKAMVDEHRIQEAKQQLENMLVEYSNHQGAWCLLGEIFFVENEFDKSWNAFQQAYELSANYENLYGSALAGYQLGKYEKTIEYCNQILQVEEIDAASMMLRGKSYLSIGDSLKACQDFTKADLYSFPTALAYKASVCKSF
jgi:curved DNA-binding protein CbpA